MAKTTSVVKKPNAKVIAAITLAVLLALTMIFCVLGTNGRKLDKEGLYKLLPWIPSLSETSEWKTALPLQADLGATKVAAYSPRALGEGELTADQLKATAKTLARRLNLLGLTGAAVSEGKGDQAGQLLVTLPASADFEALRPLLETVGQYDFADPDGNVFLSGNHIVAASYGPSGQKADDWAIAFEFDKEGKKIFGEKTAELVGKSITLMRDGKALLSPGISQALTDGAVSIPGFDEATAREYAVLMRSGALKASPGEAAVTDGNALYTNRTVPMIVKTLWVAAAVMLAYLIVRYRAAGLVAAWALLICFVLGWFFAALIGAGFTVITLMALFAGLSLAAFAADYVLADTRAQTREGRSFLRALPEAYRGQGRVALDVTIALIIIGMVLIIMDKGAVQAMAQVLTISLIINLAVVFGLMRLMLVSLVTLTGENSALYGGSAEKKEAL